VGPATKTCKKCEDWSTIMQQARVRALRAVDLGVTDLAAATRFFTEVWNLQRVAEQSGVTYLRATGGFQYVLSLRQTAKAELVRVVFDAAGRATLDGLRAQVEASGGREIGAVAALGTPGGGEGFGFKDPEGRNFAVVAGVGDHVESLPQADRPTKVSHINLNTADGDGMYAFLRDGMGFKLSDKTKPMWFLRCNADHASIVLNRRSAPALHHLAFEMPALEDVMRGIGRMRDHGYALGWGPGRHGAGDAVFAYFIGPEQLPLEYTAENLQVAEDSGPGPMSSWSWPPGRLDHWGLMPKSTEAFDRTGDVFTFSADGHLL
jgi:catechol-2,3-dioxygenase